MMQMAEVLSLVLIAYGIKFTSGNIGYSGNIYTFTYFCAFLLKDYLKEVSLDRESRE